MLREAIDSVIDTDAFNREFDQEQKDAGLLETTRRRVLRLLGDVSLDDQGNGEDV